jgi:hypothetical protein
MVRFYSAYLVSFSTMIFFLFSSLLYSAPFWVHSTAILRFANQSIAPRLPTFVRLLPKFVCSTSALLRLLFCVCWLNGHNVHRQMQNCLTIS